MRKALTLLGVLLVACSPQPQAEAAPAAEATKAFHPVSGLEIIPLTVKSHGKTYKFRVEVAATEENQIRGLMFRTELGPDEGMIFPTDPPRSRSFWMRNTVIPLDIIFIGPDHRILNIHANATPYSLDSRPSNGPASGVLEIAGGRSAELGIGPGDKVKW